MIAQTRAPPPNLVRKILRHPGQPVCGATLAAVRATAAPPTGLNSELNLTARGLYQKRSRPCGNAPASWHLTVSDPGERSPFARCRMTDRQRREGVR